jgi:hypothetical protein
MAVWHEGTTAALTDNAVGMMKTQLLSREMALYCACAADPANTSGWCLGALQQRK